MEGEDLVRDDGEARESDETKTRRAGTEPVRRLPERLGSRDLPVEREVGIGIEVVTDGEEVVVVGSVRDEQWRRGGEVERKGELVLVEAISTVDEERELEMSPKKQHLPLRSGHPPTSSFSSPLAIDPRPLSSPPPSTSSDVFWAEETSPTRTSAKLEMEEESISLPLSTLPEEEDLEESVNAWRSEEVESGTLSKEGTVRSEARDFS